MYYDLVKQPDHFSLYMKQEGVTAKHQNIPVARTHGLVVQQVVDETLVYDLAIHKACCLNTSAALVWKYCDGNNSISDIAERFLQDGHGHVSEDYVLLAIDQLNANGLVEYPIGKNRKGRSRRQLLKAVGLSTVVALPLISSLVAPPEALGSISCICTSPALCQTKPTCQPKCGGTGVCI